LLAYQDDDNFVKLYYGSSFGRRGFGGPETGAAPAEQPGAVQLLIESRGEQKTAATLSMEGIVNADNTLILKLVKKGSLYTAYCSSDGLDFKTVGTAEIVLKDIQAGLLVCDGVAPARMGGPARNTPPATQPESPFEVAFDYIRITNSGLK